MANMANVAQGTLGGAASGAMIGSLVVPGIGTGIGAAVGGGIGFLGSMFGGGDDLSDEQKAALQQQTQQQQILFGEGQQELSAMNDPTGANQQGLALLKSAALGQAPSQAQILMNQGIQGTESAAMGMAASGGGVSPALALRNAMLESGKAALSGVSQSAQLRAAEMASARNSYMSALQQQEQIKAQIITGGASNAANMAGIASQSATSLALPGAQQNATIMPTITGGTINAASQMWANKQLKDSQAANQPATPAAPASNTSSQGSWTPWQSADKG